MMLFYETLSFFSTTLTFSLKAYSFLHSSTNIIFALGKIASLYSAE